MQLVDALFSIARNITDSDIDDVNKLHDKAKNEVSVYHTDMPGYKGLYAKFHKGWLFQLCLIFAVPFVTTWLLSYKNKLMSSGLEGSPLDNEEDFDDDDEKELYEELRAKYN